MVLDKTFHVFILHLGSTNYVVGPDSGSVVGLYRSFVGISWHLCRGGTSHILVLELPPAKQRQMGKKPTHGNLGYSS